MVRYGFLDAKAGFGGFDLRLLVSQGFLGAKAEFVGFGLGLLVGQGFLDAKAPLDPRKPFLFLQPAVWGFGSEPWVRLGIPGAKADLW